ncbi:hypothetical protein ANO11243_034610 [Dothideomycetidae sp. 11243]|nr:hypothetical protein ANO11243_034610 [fungal sp. No.11243]
MYLRIPRAFVVLFSLAGLTLAVPAPAPAAGRIAIGRRQSVPPPANDPFYVPPAGFQSSAPGTVLRSRPIVASFFSDVPDPVFAWQLLYRTTAVNGSAIAGVTTVFRPLFAHLDRFVSYATAYDSSATQCDPSYAYRLGSDSSTNKDTDLEFLIIEGYLLQGYVVSSPDYEGPDAAFGPGHLSGMGVLDSMRAVTNFGSTIGFSTSKPAIVGQGYSGGALATGWAASLQPTYAPELPIKGWAHGGTPANLTEVVLYIDNTVNAGFLVAAVAGLDAPSAYRAQLNPVLTQILTAEGQSALQYGLSHCTSDDLTQYSGISLLSYDLQTLGPAVLQQPVINSIFADNIMGATASETPTAPVLVYHSAQDEIIPYAGAAALVNRWCSRGASVTFSTFASGSHEITAVLALPEVFTFVNNAFAGSVGSGCSQTTGVTSLNFLGLTIELVPILTQLFNLLSNL